MSTGKLKPSQAWVILILVIVAIPAVLVALLALCLTGVIPGGPSGGN